MKLAALATLALALVAGCAGDAGSRRGQLIQFRLTATTINAGQVGQANLVAVGERTEVSIYGSGVPPQLASWPVHLYVFLYPGTCASPGAAPAYSLTQQVLAQSPSSSGNAPPGGPFTLTNMAPVPLDVLARGKFALRVFTAPADGNREIFCGDVPGA